jgi:putative hemolysin
LRLDLADPGFDAAVLSAFRTRLRAGAAESLHLRIHSQTVPAVRAAICEPMATPLTACRRVPVRVTQRFRSWREVTGMAAAAIASCQEAPAPLCLLLTLICNQLTGSLPGMATVIDNRSCISDNLVPGDVMELTVYSRKVNRACYRAKVRCRHQHDTRDRCHG